MANHTIYSFGSDNKSADYDHAHVGNKGASLLAMSALDIPVPPGFVIPTSLGQKLADPDSHLDADTKSAIAEAITKLNQSMDFEFGNVDKPLLISVRSGAAVSMPGMMDTVLNLGLNDKAMPAFVNRTGDERFAWDTYRRFIQSFATVVLGLDSEEFELVLEELRAKQDCSSDSELSALAMKEATAVFFDIVEELSGAPFPQDTEIQLEKAILAVFRSWNTRRAVRYRDMYNYSHEGGTAAIIQAMVFGNRDQNSCTGVYFTRNPSTGENRPYGEFMINAQGEEVVSGIRTPQELTEEARIHSLSEKPSMESTMPKVFGELLAVGARLELKFADVQEIEFTVESGRLWLLQTRTGKRTPKAGLQIAVDMANEGVISKSDAVARCENANLDAMLVAKMTPAADAQLFAKGLPASPGAVSGEAVFTSQEAVEAEKAGRDCILVRRETDPKDVHGMHAAIGIMTSRGGMTSHAAVVARGMNKPCITAAMTMKIDVENGLCQSLGQTISRGDVVSIDGSTGQIFLGHQNVEIPEPDGVLATLLQWRAAGTG